MKESVANFWTGLASIVGLVGLAFLLLLFGELDEIVHPRYELTLLTDHAAGLRRGSGVELNGVPIGIIDRIEAQRDTDYPVRVVALIDDEVRIPAGSVPYAASSLLGGAAVLEIEAGTGADPRDMLASDGTAAIASTLRVRLIEQITDELDARVEDALSRLETLGRPFVQLGENLNELLGPQPAAAIEAGAAPNIRSTIAKFHEVLEEARLDLVAARVWLEDEQLRADAREVVAKAATFIDEAMQTTADLRDRVGQLQTGLQTDVDTVTASLVEVADDLSRTLEGVRNMTRLATDGPGTVSLLLNNPDLYRSLDDAATRLDQAVREAQLLIEKIKAEGLPVNF